MPTMSTRCLGVGVIAIVLTATLQLQAAAQTQVLAEPTGAPDSEAPASIADPSSASLFLPPSNDACGGAIVIPDGPYPVLSAVTTGVDQATGTGDPIDSCSPAPIENGVWYRWTPAVGGTYTITTCSASTATTDGDGVLAIFTSSGGCGGPFVQVAGACNDDACHPLGPSTISGVTFLSGTTYYILASHYPTTKGGGGIVSQYQIGIQSSAPPPNDTCFGAEIIPSGGPFPYLTTVVTATSNTSDLDLPQSGGCVAGPSGLWYRFTPPATGDYLFSTCGYDHGGTSTTTASTTIVIYTSPSGGCGGPFVEMSTTGLDDGCGSDRCLFSSNQAFLSTRLIGGNTYYVFVHVGTIPNGNLQMRVTRPSSNDVCALASPLLLDVPTIGTTGAAADDYRSPSNVQCYAGFGQTPISATGRDSVHTFTAPTTDTYSFRLELEKSQALYVGDCYGGPPPVVVSCTAGANRNTVNSLYQEAMCVFIRAGQQIWIYVDQSVRSSGSTYRLLATRCRRESEPNGTPASATSLACGMESSIDSGDVDFFSLGTPSAGSRVFVRLERQFSAFGAIVPQIRITDSSNTLQFSNQPTPNEIDWPLSGTPLPGGNVFVRVNAGAAFDPYQIYYTVQPPIASATIETEPNDTIATAETTGTGYLSGQLPGPNSSTDVDMFRFQVCKGDTIVLGLDEDPLRNATPIVGSLRLYDAGGGLLNTTATAILNSNTTPGVGLTATTPYSPGESFTYPAVYSGTYYVAVAINSSLSPFYNGDYLLSIGTDCQRLGMLLSDVSLSIADAPDPVSPGGSLDLSFTVTNAGPDIARDIVLSTATPAHSTFVSVSAPVEWTCVKPAVGGTGSVTCSAPYLEVGQKAITMAVQVNSGTPGGTVITTSANLANCHADPNPVNNTGSTTTTVTSSLSMPAAGSECYTSTLDARVHLLPSFHPGGCTETLSLSGPVKIWRSNPSDPGDGLDEVQTVMGCFMVSGTSSSCGLGSVLVHPSTATASLGKVKSSQDETIYPADARFDLVLALDTSIGAFKAVEASRETTTLNELPAPPSSTFTGNGLTHLLYDASDNVVGDIELLQQQLTTPTSCPCACAPRIAMQADKLSVAMGIPTAGPSVEYDLVRGQTSVVAPDWAASLAGAACAQSQGGPVKVDPLAPSVDRIVWYLSRDSALGANGSFNECPAIAQSGDRDADVGGACP